MKAFKNWQRIEGGNAVRVHGMEEFRILEGV